MALTGSIRDFGLADIFQLIGIQRKSGVLSLDNNKDHVRVRFVDGQVVGADNVGVKIEDLLGNVLVRTGRISQSQLDEALAIQRKTLQRLGYILLDQEYLSESDLQDALQTQVEQIVYRLFRWREGDYEFEAHEHVEFDPNFTPIGAETILMEGARMVDEWPIIERKIKSDQCVFRKTAVAAGLDGPVESIVDADIDLAIGSADETVEEISLSPDERDILRLVDGRATAQEISDVATFGEFDTYRILSDLLTRNLIEFVEISRDEPGAPPKNRTGRIATSALLAAIALAAALGGLTLPSNRYSPWRLAAPEDVDDRLRTFASRGRIEQIERAVRACFLDRGELPPDLDVLVANGFLDPGSVHDPWGRPYVLRVAANSYTIEGLDASGQPARDLTVVRTLSPAQRRLLGEDLTARN